MATASPEIVAVHSDGNHLIAFDHTGAMKWISDANPMPRFRLGERAVLIGGAISIANLDRQRARRTSSSALGVRCQRPSAWRRPDARRHDGRHRPRSAISAVGDVDLDGTPEIIAGPTAYRFAGGTADEGLAADRSQPTATSRSRTSTTIREPKLSSSASGVVYMLNHDGIGRRSLERADARARADSWRRSGRVAARRRRGRRRRCRKSASPAQTLYTLFNRDGSVRWQHAISDRSSNSTGSIAFDLDGDGQVEIIYRDEQFLRVFRGADGVLLAKSPVGSSTWAEEPVVADVDNDGHADIVVSLRLLHPARTGDTGIIVFEDVANKWTRTRRIWNQHAYHVTNVNEDGDGSGPRIAALAHVRSLNASVSMRFVPGASADGVDSFTYVATDGVLESNTATVRIAVRTPNSAPQFTSTPTVTAASGVGYSYAAQASDPDPGDVFTFSLPTAPTGMTIDPDFGVIRWTPAAAQLGPQQVTVKVTDSHGLFALQSYTAIVGTAVSVPDVIGQSQAAATSAVTTAGLVPAVSSQTHPTAPEGLVFSQTPAGQSLAAPGSPVNIVVSLGRAIGDFDNDHDNFTANQGDCNDGNANVHPGATDIPGNGIDEDCSGADAVNFGNIDADHDGFTPLQGDCNDLIASINPGATDIPGNGIDENCNGVDSVAGDSDLPTATITSPDDGAVLTMPADIVGTASDAHLLRYRLELSQVDAAASSVIGQATTAVSNGVLGRLDPTLLENGLYRVRLIVEDVNGHIAVDERVYRIDGTGKVGLLALSFIDLQVPVAGVPITVVRSYDSRVKTSRDFGVGWTLGINAGKYQNNRPPGQGWTINDRPFLGSFLPCVGGNAETRSHFTEVRLSDREVYRFTLTLSGANLGITGACEVTAGFRFIDGSTPGATLDILDGTSAIYLRGGEDILLDMNAFADGTNVIYNPRRVRLTTADGRRIEFDRLAGVTRVEDPNGNALSITPSGVIHSSGKSIAFARDAVGRLIRITDPNGNQLHYGYDGAGDLIEFIDQASNKTTFTYDDRHHLLDIHDPVGNRSVHNEYDADGRLIAVVDAAGNRTGVVHDLGARRETATDRLGNVSTVDYDARGNVIQRTDPLGHVTRFTFDARDNVLARIDPLGHMTTYTYDDRNNVLSVSDALSGTVAFTYNERNQVLTKTDARGGVTTKTYDDRGNLIRETDAAGGTTTHAYDANGNQIRSTSAAGAATTYAHDAAGNIVRTVTPLGDIIDNSRDANGNIVTETRTRLVNGVTEAAITRFTYDALNRRIRIINAGGAVHEATYTTAGQLATRNDPCCGPTIFTYDELDRRVRTLFPDGTSETATYDAEGRRLTQADRAGRVTRFTYDAAGRLLTTTFPDGAALSATYDAAGRKTSETNALGRTAVFGTTRSATRHRFAIRWAPQRWPPTIRPGTSLRARTGMVEQRGTPTIVKTVCCGRRSLMERAPRLRTTLTDERPVKPIRPEASRPLSMTAGAR